MAAVGVGMMGEEQPISTISEMMMMDELDSDIETNKNTDTALSFQEIAELKRAFNAFDMKDRPDVISTKDLGNVLRSVGMNMTNIEILDMINVLDEEENGRITFDQFIKAIAPKMREKTICQDIREAFRVFDKDGNGIINMNEFTTVLKVAVPNISSGEMGNIMTDMDANQDGSIDYEEFVAMMEPVLDDAST